LRNGVLQMAFTLDLKPVWDSGAKEKSSTKQKSKTCLHSGNVGDIIYSLPLVKALGASHYVINLCADTHFGNRNINFATAKAMASLLLAQPYLERVSIVASQVPFEYVEESITGIDYVLDKFRLQSIFQTHIALAHAKAFEQTIDVNKSWLDVKAAAKKEAPYVVAAIGPRYRVYSKEYWLEVLGGFDHIKVIGVPEDFVELSGLQAEFVTCDDFLEIAQIIKGSTLFIGNQSLAYAIAEGLKVPRILEQFPEIPNVYPTGENGHVALPTAQKTRWLVDSLLSDEFKADQKRYQDYFNISEWEQKILTLKNEEQQQRDRIAELEMQIQQQRAAIEGLSQSKAWKLVERYYGVRDSIFSKK
jgi:hypothetical protein